MKNYKYETEMKALLLTCGIVLGLCILWMILEFIIYGVVTDRVVDDIMMSLMSPFVFWTVMHFKEKDLEKEKQKESAE